MSWNSGIRLRAALAARMVWLTLLGSFLVVGLLYWQALGFAFLFDDTFDLPRVEGRSYLSLLTSSEGYSYYRPGPFLIWKLSHDLLGYYSAPLLHLMPLLFHALAGWLLYLLVSRLGAGHWAVLPGLLFLTYPFSYQNIAIVGVLFHPLAGAAILASLNLYLSARQSAERRACVLYSSALAATLVALWSHESGVVVAPLIVALEALILWQRGQRRPSWWVLGHSVATLAFVIAWLTVEKTAFGETVTLGDLHPKALFFAQGFTYPLSAQIQWLDDRAGWAPGILQVLALALAFVFGAYVRDCRVKGDLTRLAYPVAGLTIAGVAALPSMARLSWPYVEDAPRLLYLVGIGSALFWGLLPALDFGRKRVTVVWRIATLGFLLAVVLQSWVFVDRRMEMFASGSSAVHGIVGAGERHVGRGILVMNAPSWLAQHQYEYPYGHLGVQVMPAYIGLDRVVYTSSRWNVHVDAASASLAPDVAGGRFTFGPHGAAMTAAELDGLLREGRVVYDVRREGDGFELIEIGRLAMGGGGITDQVVELEHVPVAVGRMRSVNDDNRLSLYLSWHVAGTLRGEHAVRVELVNEAGAVVDRYQGLALAGVSDPALWQPGDRIDDRFIFERPVAGTYTIRAGLGGNAVEIGEIVVTN